MTTIALFVAVIALGATNYVTGVLAIRSSFRSGYWAGVHRTSEAYEIWDDDNAIVERVGPPPKPPI